ncbi:MAG: hypothetical protein PHO23_02925 [Candidatus Pacebacteria bacterium]|nr:hypothetical protein [Candidatus Paceibacterota bacterium]
MDICEILSEDYLHDVFLALNYEEILKHKEHFLECPNCFNKLLNAYFHYFAFNFFLIDNKDKDVVLESVQDPQVKLLIANTFEKGGKLLYNEESFTPEINTGSLFVSFCEIANSTESTNLILINGEVDFPKKSLKEIILIFLNGFSNIKHIAMFNKHKLFNLEDKVDFYPRYFKETTCAFAQEEVKDYGFLTYVQSCQNTERVILLSKTRLIGEIK